MGSCCVKENEHSSDSVSSSNHVPKLQKSEYHPSATDDPSNANPKSHYSNKISLDNEISPEDLIKKMHPDNEYYYPHYEKNHQSHESSKEEYKDAKLHDEKENYDTLLNQYKDIENKLNLAENKLNLTENELQANKEELEKAIQDKVYQI